MHEDQFHFPFFFEHNRFTMKSFAILAAVCGSATAFAPQVNWILVFDVGKTMLYSKDIFFFCLVHSCWSLNTAPC